MGPTNLEGSFVLRFYGKGAYKCQFGNGTFKMTGDVSGVASDRPIVSREMFTTRVTINLYDP